MKLKHKFIYWIPALIVAVVIFYFSSRTGRESNAQSDPIVYTLNGFLNYKSLLPLIRIVRKSGHLIEFALLGLTLYFAVEHSEIRHPLAVTLLFAYLYAVSDEIHQYFVPERSASFTDTLIDFTGIVIGVLVYRILKRHKKIR